MIAELDSLGYRLYIKFKDFHLTTLASERRHALVTVAHLTSLAEYVYWGDPLGKYCHDLLWGLVINGADALVAYLDALPPAFHLGEEDRAWIDDMAALIRRLSRPEWERAFAPGCFERAVAATVAPAPSAAAAALARQQAADEELCGTRSPYDRLDDERLLIDCDLAAPCDALGRALGRTPAAGIYSFALAGDQGLVQEFVLPRIQRELRATLARETTGHFFWAAPANGGATGAGAGGITLQADRPLARPWREQFHAFAADRDANHLAVVWNDHRLAPDDVAAFAADVQAELFPALLPLVRQNDQVFLILWADIARPRVAAQPCYDCLPLPDRLEADEIMTHFNRQLRGNVADQDRECALSKIEYCLNVTGGHPKAAYPRLRDIVYSLKDGRI